MSQTQVTCYNCRGQGHIARNCPTTPRQRTDTAKTSADFSLKLSDGGTGQIRESFLIDCGATTHIINRKDCFITRDDKFVQENHVMVLADGTRKSGDAEMRGDVKVTFVDSDGNSRTVILSDVLYMPSYPTNIISVKAVVDKGAQLMLNQDNPSLVMNDGTKFSLMLVDRLYYLPFSIPTCSDVVNNAKSLDLYDWHIIFGHCNQKDILRNATIVDGMEINSKSMPECEICIENKKPNMRNREAAPKSNNVFDLVYSDLAGPITPVGKQGFKYAMNFVDDHSGAVFVYPLKRKSDAVKCLKLFLADSKKYGAVKALRSDNGTEYVNQEFLDVLLERGIAHQTSAPYSPHQNGCAERNWRTIFEMTRCMINANELPKSLWPYAVLHAAYLRNRCPSSWQEGETPYSIITGTKPDVRDLEPFGKSCFSFDHTVSGKLDKRWRKGIFCGYDRRSPALFVFHPETNTVAKYRNVQFLNSQPSMQNQNVTNDDFEEATNDKADNDVSIQNDVMVPTSDDDNVVSAPNLRRNPVRERKPPVRFQDYSCCIECEVDYCYRMTTDVPMNYSEAVSSTENRMWKTAMDSEMKSMSENDVYELVPPPNDQNVIDGKWVYCVKYGSNNEKRYKARYVAKGFTQCEGIDYHETFSPTARMTSVRMAMQLTAQYDLSVSQLDVKTAFLNAPVDCELYLKQPEGYDDGDFVWKLKKSIYGLKQSGRNWNRMLHDYLTEIGFSQSQADCCMYTRLDEHSFAMILVWVDDMLIVGSNVDVIDTLKLDLNLKFKITDFGVPSKFLGINFTFGKGYVKMDQSQYIRQLLEKAGFADCNPRKTPCEAHLLLLDTGDVVNEKAYREKVGNLIFAMTCTRPDISWIVSKLSQYMHKPTQQHHNAVKHVLQYLKGSTDDALIFHKSDDPLKLSGYCDADWASSADRRSTSGYCFRLNEISSPISWRSHRQSVVAISSCEAEYVSLALAIQEALFLRQLFIDMWKPLMNDDPVVVHCDNQGSVALAKNPVFHKRSKHIDVKYHFIRDVVNKNLVQLKYVHSGDNVADVFTKGLGKNLFGRFKQQLLNI